MKSPVEFPDSVARDNEKVLRTARYSRRRGDMAGASVLRELPWPAAVYAFRVLRSAVLWSAKPGGEQDERRQRLFDRSSIEALAIEVGSSALPDGLKLPLVGILVEMANDDPDVSHMERGCLYVSEWALEVGARGSALAFAEAAADLATNPRFVFIAGRMHRSLGDLRDAVAWLRYAIALATRAMDWETQVRSTQALGITFLHAGNYPRAEQTLRLALRQAVRRRVQELAGEIWHHIFITLAEAGRFIDADTAVREASKAYGRYDERLPYFAHDLAVYAMDRGDHQSALFVLIALVDRHWSDQPGNLLLAYGNILRASGGCGERAEFETSATRFHQLLDVEPHATTRAKALVAAAQGGMAFSLWLAAEAWLREAVLVAAGNGQQGELIEAETLLARLAEARSEHASAARPERARFPRYREVARTTVRALGGRL